MTVNQRIKIVRESNKLTQVAFAEAIGTSRSNLAQIELDKQNPTLEILTAIVKRFGVTYDYLMGLQPDMQVGLNSKQESTPTPQSTLPENTLRSPIAEIRQVDKTHFVNAIKGIEMVPIIDISVAAGAGYMNTEYAEEMEMIHLPERLLKKGTHRAVRIKGESMAPTLSDGGYVLIRYRDKSEWFSLRNENVFVIIDKEGQAYIKRVKNRLKSHDFITLMSDNPDKATYQNFNLFLHEIEHIWDVEWYFTAKMPNIHDTYYARLQRLEDRIDEQTVILDSLTKRIGNRN